jgi:mono/diheme cytochrome c family protein
MSVHDSHHREPPDLPPGKGPVPLWIAFLAAGLSVWAVGYLVFYNGGFRGDVYDETWTPRSGQFTAEEGDDPVALGQKVYRANCAVCHQPDGGGVPGLYPPLAGSDIILGRDGFGENHLARIVMNGLVEPVTVRGTVYSGAMAAWKEMLGDAQIAAVLTYVRQAWGNQAGPLSSEQIALLRTEVGQRFEPWTVALLKQIPPAPLPRPATKAADQVPNDTR